MSYSRIDVDIVSHRSVRLRANIVRRSGSRRRSSSGIEMGAIPFSANDIAAFNVYYITRIHLYTSLLIIPV